jgi:cell division septal protein FtsQ
VLPIVFLLCILAGAIFTRKYFVISTIQCSMDSGSCPDPVMAELNRLKGQSIFFVETVPLEQKLRAALPKAQSLVFEKHPPRTLSLVISSYPSAFFVQAGQRYYLLNETGRVVDESDTLPDGNFNITLPTNTLNTGDVIDQSTFSALLSLTTELKKTSLPVNTIVFVDPNQLMLQLTDSHVAILKSDDIFSQLTTLQRILNEATMSGSGHVIDVRFAHPIIKQ